MDIAKNLNFDIIGGAMTIETLEKPLKQYFGFETFKPLQKEIITTILDKKDCLVLMPTGGGKSLCYQLPATVLPGLTIVVSPLISLMKDQVEGLTQNGVPAAYLNSTVTFEEFLEIKKAAKNNDIKLLYVSPEKLVSNDFQYFLNEIDISLFAIDEAHCISVWGHDFRREYTQLGGILERFNDVPIIALTATADKLTRKDIVVQLNLKNPKIFISSFDRPNLRLKVLPAKKRLEYIVAFLKNQKNNSGIIYCLSRNQTEKLSGALKKAGFKSAYYHAGMEANDRTRVQEDFTYGKIDIMVATNAFGMGIDKSNVRFVIHYNLPKNLEAYYQEIGRAGRDGLTSQTLLFYTLADVILLKKFAIESGQPDLQLAKLERMQQYADAFHCRRRILLTYFGEEKYDNCDNCDICENPPQFFDGTEIAQKALSAIARLKEKVGVNLLIDVLRGSAKQEIFYYGFDKIKTYGAGRETSFNDWREYILQMLNMGLLDIAYDKNNCLYITSAGKEVLLGKRKVQFVTAKSLEERAKLQEEETKQKTAKETVEEELFEKLRALRKQIAQREKVPPYIVFSDATLEQMVNELPISEREMKKIYGVADKKFKSYGKDFIDVIIDFIKTKDKERIKISGNSPKITFTYYADGMGVDQIAEQRNLTQQTIYSHLAELYEQGYKIKISKFIDKTEIKNIMESIHADGIPEKLKSLYDRFGGKYDYHKLKFAIAYYHFNSKERGVVRYD